MREVVVGLGSCGVAAGGLAVQQRLKELLEPGKERVTLKETGCIGLCYREVLVEVFEDGRPRTLYGGVTPERVDRIVEEHLRQGRAVAEWVVDREEALAKQKRIVLRNCGEIDPSCIEEYQARGGYLALEKAVTGMTPEQVIEIVAGSGLRGVSLRRGAFAWERGEDHEVCGCPLHRVRHRRQRRRQHVHVRGDRR